MSSAWMEKRKELLEVPNILTMMKLHRVACVKQGGVRWTINGNPYFFLVLVYNVGGAGDVQEMYVKGSNTGWYNMWRNWGTMWTATPSGRLQGQALSFRVVTSDGNSLTSWNAAPSNWAFGQTFEGSQYY